MTTVFHAWPYGRFIEIKNNLRIKKLQRKNKGSNFLGGTFSTRDNVRISIQFRTESQPKHLKRWFFLKNRPIHFYISSNRVNRHVKRNQLSFFPALKSTIHLLPKSTASRRSDSSSEANCYHRSDAFSLCVETSIINNSIIYKFFKVFTNHRN